MIQNIKLTKDQKIVEEIEEGKTNTTKELIARRHWGNEIWSKKYHSNY